MIPKIIHISWKDKSVINSQSDLIVNGLKNLIALNPGWDVQISTDEEVDAYLKRVLDDADYALIADVGIVAKTDLWRLIKLLEVGGVYIDIDRLCNKPLDPLLEDGVKWVLPICGDMDFSHDFMMTAPGNPAYANTIKLYLDRRRAGHTNIYFLGAQTYMHGVTYTLLGEMIDSNPGVERFDKIREHLSSIPFIRAHQELPPSDTVMYQGDITPEGWESMKREFYKENQIKHWTGEW